MATEEHTEEKRWLLPPQRRFELPCSRPLLSALSGALCVHVGEKRRWCRDGRTVLLAQEVGLGMVLDLREGLQMVARK